MVLWSAAQEPWSTRNLDDDDSRGPNMMRTRSPQQRSLALGRLGKTVDRSGGVGVYCSACSRIDFCMVCARRPPSHCMSAS